MKITVEKLKQFDEARAAQYADYIKSYGEDGVEFLELIKDKNVDPTLLNFIYKYFTFNEEELKAYNDYFQIVDSQHVWNSSRITQSDGVVVSSDVFDGSEVIYSSKITSGHNIHYSRNVLRAANIFNSSEIVDCSFIVNCRDVKASDYIVNSDFVDYSSNIFGSSHIRISQFIYQSRDLKNCYFCGFTTASNNCAFCISLLNGEYQVFNKKVGRARFEEIREQLLDHLLGESAQFIKIISSPLKLNSIQYNNRFDAIFEGLSEDFFDWVKDLPEFDESIFRNIFYRE